MDQPNWTETLIQVHASRYRLPGILPGSTGTPGPPPRQVSSWSSLSPGLVSGSRGSRECPQEPSSCRQCGGRKDRPQKWTIKDWWPSGGAVWGPEDQPPKFSSPGPWRVRHKPDWATFPEMRHGTNLKASGGIPDSLHSHVKAQPHPETACAHGEEDHLPAATRNVWPVVPHLILAPSCNEERAREHVSSAGLLPREG